MFTSLIRRFSSRGERSVGAAGALPSVEEIQRLLDRERARADRTGSKLSILVFPCENAPDLVPILVEILRSRLRTTDEVGWLDRDSLCAVLPDTPAAGAWKVADDVAHSLSTDLPFAGYLVYTYPDEPLGRSGETVETQPAEAPPEARVTVALESLLVQPTPMWKRAVDVIVSVAALLLLSPLLVLIGLAIKLTSRGPILFRQLRSGLGGKPFTIYKFRTMFVDAEKRKQELLALNEQDGPAFKIKADPRITSLGRILRATSLDELPQLWNVLVGEMSLVGPRPLPCDEAARCTGWQRRRLMVTPGLTCIWQVHGRCRVSFAEWMRMDVRYVRSQSPGRDAVLIIQTIPAVLFQSGAH